MPENDVSKEFDAILNDYSMAEPGKPQQTEEDEELVKDLDAKFIEAHEAKSPYETDWEFFRLYIKGEQLIARNRDTGEVVRISEDDTKKLRSMMNILRPTGRSLIGKMTRTIPTCVVTPATADFEEQHGARAGTALMEFFRRDQRLDSKYVAAHEYIPWAGNGFLHLYWDRQGGRRLAYCKVCDFNLHDEDMVGQPCPQCTQQRQQEMAMYEMQREELRGQAIAEVMSQLPPGVEPDPSMIPMDIEPPEMQQMGPLPQGQEPPALIEVREGKPAVAVRDPRHVFFEPGAESVHEAQWFCVRIPLPVSKLRRMFPEWGHSIHKDDNLVVDRTAELRYNNLDAESSTEVLADHAYLWEFHERPTERFPDGRTVFRVNEIVVRKLDGEEGNPPNPDAVLDRHPVYHIGFDKNPGEIWYEPFCTQAWHRQREINRLETQLREHVELGLRPRLFIPIGSRVSTDEITADSDQLIKYNAAAGPPIPVTFPPLPNQVVQRRNDLIADVQMQASVTQQDMGISPADPNGRAMAIIEAESDQQLGPILTRNHEEWRDLHRGYLQMFQAYAHPEAKWSIPGPEGVQMYSFNELILRSGWDIQIEQEDGLSRNPAIRLQQAMEVKNAIPEMFIDLNTGMPDAKKFARFAKLRVHDAGYDLQATERAAASQIPYLIKEGQPYQPQMWDDPQIFAEELLGWLRGPGRREDQELVQQIVQLWQYYVTWTTLGMPPEMAQEQMGPGGGPGPETGPEGGSGPGGPDMTAPGGSPNNPGHVGTDVMSEAAGTVSEADRYGESQSRIQSAHEG